MQRLAVCDCFAFLQFLADYFLFDKTYFPSDSDNANWESRLIYDSNVQLLLAPPIARRLPNKILVSKNLELFPPRIQSQVKRDGGSNQGRDGRKDGHEDLEYVFRSMKSQ